LICIDDAESSELLATNVARTLFDVDCN